MASQGTENFNTGPDIGISEFAANHVRNEITWSMFRRVVEESRISPLLRPRLPAPHEPACQASQNGEVAIYALQVLMGPLRLPLSPRAVELLQFYCVSPRQLSPNGWLIWTCFVLLCKRNNVGYDLEIFRHYYQLIPAAGGGKRVKGGHRDVGYFSIRARGGVFNSLVTKLPDNVKGWKAAWFFVADPGNSPHNWSSRVSDDKYHPVKYSLPQVEAIDGVFRSRDAGIPYSALVGPKADTDWEGSGLFPAYSLPFEPNWV